jgi:hypothetical protein
MRVAFDLDGVLADMDSALTHHEQQLFGETTATQATAASSEPAEVTESVNETDPLSLRMQKRGWSPGRRRRLWKEVESVENFWETLDEIEPGAVTAIAEHTASRRWEVIFLTKRPSTEGLTSQRQSQRWLQRHGFPLPSVFVVQGSRGKIAEALALDVVVDDLSENCVDVISDSSAKAILVCRDQSKRTLVNATRLGIATVATVAECLEMLVRLDETRRRPPIMDRLKRALGFAARQS